MVIGKWWRRFMARRLAVLLGTIALVECQQRQEPTLGSETHFLTRCDATCPNGNDCVCGACTRSCASKSECTVLSPLAECTDMAPRISVGRCSESEQLATCDVNCLVDTDCASLGSAFACQSGYCRLGIGSVATIADASSSSSCHPPPIAAADVLVLGDSLIELTGFTAELERHAADAGLLATDEHFRQSASALMSFMAEGSFSIGAQYAAVRQEATSRLVVMDGGETDMFDPLCATEPAYGCPTVQSAVNGAINLLQQMSQDGVEQVVYFFYPDPVGDAELKSRLDVLRPLIENACGQSPVACHWIDLRPTFAGHDDYFVQDGKMFSVAGASAAADAVWRRLQERCIMP